MRNFSVHRQKRRHFRFRFSKSAPDKYRLGPGRILHRVYSPGTSGHVPGNPRHPPGNPCHAPGNPCRKSCQSGHTPGQWGGTPGNSRRKPGKCRRKPGVPHHAWEPLQHAREFAPRAGEVAAGMRRAFPRAVPVVQLARERVLHARNSAPHARKLAPHARKLAPHARKLAPHAGKLAPHARELPPHAREMVPQAEDDPKRLIPGWKTAWIELGTSDLRKKPSILDVESTGGPGLLTISRFDDCLSGPKPG
jgi:hypothetical protein